MRKPKSKKRDPLLVAADRLGKKCDAYFHRDDESRCDAKEAAERALLDTVPTTAEGALVKLVIAGGLAECTTDFLGNRDLDGVIHHLRALDDLAKAASEAIPLLVAKPEVARHRAAIEPYVEPKLWPEVRGAVS